MDAHAKKTLFRKIPYGLYVVGVKGHDSLNAFTGSWISQCSLKPPMVMMGVREDAHSLELLREEPYVSINFLRKDQQDVCAHFFKPAKLEGHRLADIAFHVGKTGTPLLDDCVGSLECHVKNIMSYEGDHVVVIAEVIEAHLKEDQDILNVSDTPWHYGG